MYIKNKVYKIFSIFILFLIINIIPSVTANALHFNNNENFSMNSGSNSFIFSGLLENKFTLGTRIKIHHDNLNIKNLSSSQQLLNQFEHLYIYDSFYFNYDLISLKFQKFQSLNLSLFGDFSINKFPKARVGFIINLGIKSSVVIELLNKFFSIEPSFIIRNYLCTNVNTDTVALIYDAYNNKKKTLTDLIFFALDYKSSFFDIIDYNYSQEYIGNIDISYDNLQISVKYIMEKESLKYIFEKKFIKLCLNFSNKKNLLLLMENNKNIGNFHYDFNIVNIFNVSNNRENNKLSEYSIERISNYFLEKSKKNNDRVGGEAAVIGEIGYNLYLIKKYLDIGVFCNFGKIWNYSFFDNNNNKDITDDMNASICAEINMRIPITNIKVKFGISVLFMENLKFTDKYFYSVDKEIGSNLYFYLYI